MTLAETLPQADASSLVDCDVLEVQVKKAEPQAPRKRTRTGDMASVSERGRAARQVSTSRRCSNVVPPGPLTGPNRVVERDFGLSVAGWTGAGGRVPFDGTPVASDVEGAGFSAAANRSGRIAVAANGNPRRPRRAPINWRAY